MAELYADQTLSLGQIASLACLLEATAAKPGNVHRGADFEDVTFADFMISAVVVGGVFDRTKCTCGELILSAVQATQAAVGTNTNLGIVLLLGPLVVAARNQRGSSNLNRQHVVDCLRGLTLADGEKIYRSIQVAAPGGMGAVDELDVQATTGPVALMAAMKLAQQRDAIARQYVNGFDDVFGIGQTLLQQGKRLFPELTSAIVYAHVAWMAAQPDTLIARKCGSSVAQKAQTMAQQAIDQVPAEVLTGGRPWDSESLQAFWQSVAELDFWLRCDGHRRNPGTTADLIAASLFVAIHNRQIEAPYR